jgi:hypothetical protein
MDYKRINWLIAIVLIIAILFSNVLLNGDTKFVLITILIIICGLAIIANTAYCPRKCKKCGIKMLQHYREGDFTPDYYKCPNCNYKEDTNIRNDAPI